MVAVATGISLGGGNLRYRALIVLSILSVLVVSAVGSGASADVRRTSLADEIDHASREYGVPRELLLAMGYVNTRWEMPPPSASDYESGDPEGQGNYGVMALVKNPSRDTLGEASTLTGLSVEALKSDRAANVRGGAAVLADLAAERKPSDLGGWYDAVSDYGGGALYAEQVYEVLKGGASATTTTGEHLELAPHDVDVPGLYSAQATGDYPRSRWYGNGGSNYTESRREPTHDIKTIVIHVTQGSWSSAINYFASRSNKSASAHYTVRSSDGRIGQSVHEPDVAWHAGHWRTNTHSIGIEHEGFVNQPRWFTNAMYRSSARLSAYLAVKYHIPINRKHIIGHKEVPGCSTGGGGAGCHTDPGRYWRWHKYMGLVKDYARPMRNQTYQQIVDNATSGRFRASDRWTSSARHAGANRGANQRVLARPLSVSENAAYKIRTPARDSYRVYGWWPADPDYNTKTSFKIKTTGGWAHRTVNQRINGGRWIYLGTYNLAAADSYRVHISSKSSSRGRIVADAVKIMRQ
jgi:N-acetyl-anhydromuramyl-L-alanine amidase AmpD